MLSFVIILCWLSRDFWYRLQLYSASYSDGDKYINKQKTKKDIVLEP